MKILVTNDDGYRAKGIKTLVEILKPYGDILVVAPKYVQSGTSMGVTMGYKPIAVKKLSEAPGEVWYYLDGTPASCVKFGVGELYGEEVPDVIVSGINHGGNYATAALYSGTLGAAMEGALMKIPSIAVSLDSLEADADFSVVERHFPALFETLMSHLPERFGIVYNLNFPAVAPEAVKGVRIPGQGVIRWVREYAPFDPGFYERKGLMPHSLGIRNIPDPEPEEDFFVMGGTVVRDPDNGPDSDVELIAGGYITLTAHSILTTDAEEQDRLRAIGLEELIRSKA